MPSDSKQLTRRLVEFSLGPLQFRSASVRECSERDDDGPFTLQAFADELRVLVDLALREGCTRQDITTILGQYTHGDDHVDA